MKKTVLSLLVVLVVLATACNSGSKSSNEKKELSPEAQEMVDRQMERMTSLDLSAEQEAEIREIIAANNDDMLEMREQMRDGGNREGMREQMQQVREEQNAKMKKVLSEEQWVKYEEAMKEMRGRRGEGRRGGGEGRPE